MIDSIDKTVIYSDLTKFDILKGYLNSSAMITKDFFDILLLLRKHYRNYLLIVGENTVCRI